MLSSRVSVARSVMFLAVGVASVAVLSGCTGPAGPPSGAPSGAATVTAPSGASAPSGSAIPQHPDPSSTPSALPTDETGSDAPSSDPIAGLTLQQRVGQVFMVGTRASAAGSTTVNAITRRHAGNIFLSGRSTAGVTTTGAVVSRFTRLVNAKTTGGVPLWVSTDQEGGQVQVLQGSGFDAMPTGLAQGKLSASALRSDAARWGSQLSSAGLNMNLAPVVDLLPSRAKAAQNPPIGAFQREYGFTSAVIDAHADAFRAGMKSSGVQTVMKHFPGLGNVTANTDTTANVKDTVTTGSSASVTIYRHGIKQGADAIMMSSAIYTKLDKTQPGVFSHKVVTDLLRDKLGFDGLIMTDDVSGATQVLKWTPAQRAIKSLEAGVDLVLVSADPGVAPAMIDAVVAKAKADPAFAAVVDAAARRVVTMKNASLK